MNTINIPILGLEEHGGTVVVPDYGAALGISITDDALEVPVETVITEDDELQAMEIGNYAVARPIPNVHEIQTQQPFVIASTDSQGNCYVTMQESYILKTNSDTSRNVQVPRVTRLPNTNHPIGRRSFMRFGRSRMIADQLTTISVSDFKAQLNDTSDIIGRLELAPTTKAAMKELGSKGISKIFSASGQRIRSSKLLHIFRRHLNTSLQNVEETFSDMTLLPVGYQPEIDPTKIKRITRRRRYPGAEEYQRRMIQQQMQHTFNNLVAESQKNMEAVFMENSTPVAENQDNLQILVDAAQNGTVTNEESQKVVGMFQLEEMNENSIIVIHNGEEATEIEDLPTGQYEYYTLINHAVCRLRLRTTMLPTERNNVLKFTNHGKQLWVPFMVYADFKAILKPVHTCSQSLKASFTNATHIHEPYSFAYYFYCSYESSLNKLELFRGPVAAKIFLKRLEKDAVCLGDILNTNIPMQPLTQLELQQHESTVNCTIYGGEFLDNDPKVFDHDHLAGKYRCAAHNSCNLKCRVPAFIPVIFHNLSGYGSHFIIQKFYNPNDKFEVISKNKERYVKVSDKYMVKLCFLDSFHFVTRRLDKLASNLQTDQFTEIQQSFPDQRELLPTQRYSHTNILVAYASMNAAYSSLNFRWN